MSRRILCRSRAAACFGMLAAVLAQHAVAQSASGSPAAAVVGGMLGAYSGLLLGFTGSIIPCSQRLEAVRCIQISAGTTAAVASVSGVLLGSADEDRIWRASRDVGIGVGIGALTGLVLGQVTQRVGLRDVGALALFGGAVGAVPRGVGIGLGVGGAFGLVLVGMTDLGWPDAIGMAAAGMALGGLAQWILDAHDARSAADGPAFTLLSYRLAF